MTLARRSGELERTYFDVFDRFARMIADGTSRSTSTRSRWRARRAWVTA